MPNKPGIIPKFSTILLFGLICLCNKIKAGEGSVRMSFRTQRWHVPLRTTSLLEGSSDLQEAYTKACPNSAKKIPHHVGAMSWHRAKFHEFQACFGFTGIKKPRFSIFTAEARCPDVWIWLPFLAWDLEIHPRTHMRFFNKLWCTGACICSSNLNYAH